MSWEGPFFVSRLNMYTVHLDTLGMIHKCKLIADSVSLDIKKAGPFLTLPEFIFITKISYGVYQIGDVYARSWVIMGTSGPILTPKRLAS